jgi:hypothetical protein
MPGRVPASLQGRSAAEYDLTMRYLRTSHQKRPPRMHGHRCVHSGIPETVAGQPATEACGSPGLALRLVQDAAIRGSGQDGHGSHPPEVSRRPPRAMEPPGTAPVVQQIITSQGEPSDARGGQARFPTRNRRRGLVSLKAAGPRHDMSGLRPGSSSFALRSRPPLSIKRLLQKLFAALRDRFARQKLSAPLA